MRPSRLRLAFVRKAALLATTGMMAVLALYLIPSSTETAVANGDTRTLNLYHSHTGESIQATFRVNGAYDPAVLARLNYFLRDWRNNDVTHMDPRLFDVIWEVYRTAGATEPVVIVSAYRSPETNAMLRRRSHAVAEHSQHILGRAMDTTMPGMPMERIREIGMRLQRGGVGWYPGENFVHLDVGNVRAWPRMSYDQLVRLFPDGKTVHLAADGRTLPRYQEARAEIASRGGAVSDVPQESPGRGFFAWLFGSHDEEPGETSEAETARQQAPSAHRPSRLGTEVASLRTQSASPAESTTDNPAVSARRDQIAASPAPANHDAAQSPQNPSGTDRVQVADLRASMTQGESDPAPVRLGAGKKWNLAVPLPPVRPVLAEPVGVAFVNAPLPPARPASLTHVGMLAPELASIPDGGPSPRIAGKSGEAKAPGLVEAAPPMTRAVNLPVVITQGPKDRIKVPDHVLAFAAEIPIEDLPTVAASKTPSQKSSRSTTSTATVDRVTPGDTASRAAPAVHLSVLGPSFTGLRRVARNFPGALSGAPTADHMAAFGAAASDLDTQHFISPSSQPLALAGGLADPDKSSSQDRGK